MKKWFLVMLASIVSHSLLAQGDGPRSFLLAPTGIWGLNGKWVGLNQNLLPSGNILISEADLKVHVFPTTAFHTFGIHGKFAQILIMVNPGTASGSVAPDQPAIPAPDLSASGYGDGFLGFKLGLIGAPALHISEFSKRTPAFSMMGYVRIWYSGTYNNKKPLNMGTHRTTFEIGLPMNMPISKNPMRATWLEVYPSIQLYTTNHNPTLITRASKSHQLPLFLLENHLTHSFSTKFWAGVDLRFQYGGELKLDDEKQDNRINILGGGVSAGYQFLPFLSGSASYGSIFIGDNRAQSQMVRISIVLVYANTRKINTP